MNISANSPKKPPAMFNIINLQVIRSAAKCRRAHKDKYDNFMMAAVIISRVLIMLVFLILHNSDISINFASNDW